MELDYSRTFAEQYNIDPRGYIDVRVASLPFSVRVANRFQRLQINTVSDLLEKTPEDLMKVSGFGKGCLVDIDNVLTAIQHDLTSGANSPLETNNLQTRSISYEEWVKETYEILDEGLVFQCKSNVAYVDTLISALKEFCYCAERYGVIQGLLNAIPKYRLANEAKGYIYAYTNDESKREILLGQYANSEAELGRFSGNGLDNESTFFLAQKFLKWCAFDLTNDVNSLIAAVAGQGKLQTVVEMRARKLTLEKIGNKLNVTRERIRQLELKALRIFARSQGRIKLIAKISAEKNGDSIITPADIERYSGEHSVELLFLLRNYKGGTYTYDEQLGVFVIGDDSLHDRVYSYLETLPEMFSVKQIPEILETAKEEQELPESIVQSAIADAYRLTGDVYHRSRLSLATIYTSILQTYYPQGINAYDPEEIKRFRERVFESYGAVKLPENDRALTARIAGICILCGRGMYKLKQKQYIPKSLAKRIYDYIVYGDESIYLMNTLFSVFEDELRKSGVDNKYFLQGILHELYGDELVFTRDYVSTDDGETSIYASVVSFIQNSAYPVSKAQIQKKFPGISDIVINFSVSNPNVLNYFGEYLHTSRLRITPEEERYLDKVMRNVLGDSDSHHVKDLYEVIHNEKPEVLTRNGAMYPFSAYSILEYLFRDSFQFSRPYIALKGVNIGRPAERLHDLLYSMDEFSFDDISDFAKENHYMIQSQLDFVNSCNDKYLIVNGSQVLSIEKIGVTEEIAKAVEAAVIAEVTSTVPIRELTCWAQFPHINISWTDWLVYSVLNKWGTKVSVAPSSNQFRLSVPLVAPMGELTTAGFADAYKDVLTAGQIAHVEADDLNNLDDILADILSDELLEDESWD